MNNNILYIADFFHYSESLKISLYTDLSVLRKEMRKMYKTRDMVFNAVCIYKIENNKMECINTYYERNGKLEKH